MKLPDAIEREIRAIEAEFGSLGGQQAGSPRLRGLRSAIETALAAPPAAGGERTCERCRYSRPGLDECFNVEAFGHDGGPLCSIVKFCGAFAPRTEEP